ILGTTELQHLGLERATQNRLGLDVGHVARQVTQGFLRRHTNLLIWSGLMRTRSSGTSLFLPAAASLRPFSYARAATRWISSCSSSESMVILNFGVDF